MAVIKYPVNMALVKGLRHTADFYYQRGRQVVRVWPKKSNLVPTPGQLVQRNNFRAIECTLKSQGPQQRAAWQSWQPYNGQTWVDFLHRVWMQPAHLGKLFTMWDWSDWHVRQYISGPPRLNIFWNPSLYPYAFQFDVIASPVAGTASKWTWEVFDYKIQRGRLRQPRWQPRVPDAIRFSPSHFSAESGFIGYDMPREWRAVCFAAVHSENPDNKALLTACHFAKWEPR